MQTTVLTGRFRTPNSEKPSVFCVRATTSNQMVSGRRLWTSQFQKAGLIDDSRVSSREAESLSIIGKTLPEQWTSVSINAYQAGSRVPKGVEDRSTGKATSQSRFDGVCGTVTLLVPKRTDLTVGKITRLAIDSSQQAQSGSPIAYRCVFLELTSFLYQTAVEYGLTDLEAIVHPRHAKLYRRVFNAKPIGKPFDCEAVAGAPAQLMRADIRDPKLFHPRLRECYVERSSQRAA